MDSLHFLPAETDGGEGEVEMIETHGDKSKKVEKKWEQGEMLSRQASAWGRERRSETEAELRLRDGLCNPAGNKGGYGFVWLQHVQCTSLSAITRSP